MKAAIYARRSKLEALRDKKEKSNSINIQSSVKISLPTRKTIMKSRTNISILTTVIPLAPLIGQP